MKKTILLFSFPLIFNSVIYVQEIIENPEKPLSKNVGRVLKIKEAMSIVDEPGKFYFDVFNTEGKYIAKVPLNALPQYWKNRKMYTIEEDEDGYQYVKRYKVTWKY